MSLLQIRLRETLLFFLCSLSAASALGANEKNFDCVANDGTRSAKVRLNEATLYVTIDFKDANTVEGYAFKGHQGEDTFSYFIPFGLGLTTNNMSGFTLRIAKSGTATADFFDYSSHKGSCQPE